MPAAAVARRTPAISGSSGTTVGASGETGRAMSAFNGSEKTKRSVTPPPPRRERRSTSSDCHAGSAGSELELAVVFQEGPAAHVELAVFADEEQRVLRHFLGAFQQKLRIVGPHLVG